MAEPAALDAVSRQALARFGSRSCWFSLFAIVPTLAGGGSIEAAAALLALTFGFGGLLSGLFGALRREPFAHGGLNDWDESLAFVALSQLAHLVARVAS